MVRLCIVTGKGFIIDRNTCVILLGSFDRSAVSLSTKAPMCVHCEGIHGRFRSASLRNFFLSSLSVSLKLAAGAFLEDMIPRNEFSFQVFATDYMVFVGAIYLITFKLKIYLMVI